MLKKIAITKVQAGMFLHSVEGSWLNHSMWKSRFLIKDEETRARVRDCGASECWIDTSQGSDVPAQAAAATPIRVARKSMALELQNASSVLKRSKSAMTSLFSEARMGNAIDTSHCLPLVTNIVESVDNNSDALISLCRLKTADEYTYMHS